MGQDDSCGICGKHFMECRHFRKEHFRKEHLFGADGALCGLKGDIIFNDPDAATDPYVLCKRCLKKRKTAKGKR